MIFNCSGITLIFSLETTTILSNSKLQQVLGQERSQLHPKSPPAQHSSSYFNHFGSKKQKIKQTVDQ